MKTIKINQEGFVKSLYVTDASIDFEVDDELYEKLMTCKIGKNWKLQDGEFIVVELLDDEIIRFRREIECFAIIDNRSQLWWNHLTDDKKNELDVWYEAWLNATETKVIPEKPEWLN